MKSKIIGYVMMFGSLIMISALAGQHWLKKEYWNFTTDILIALFDVVVIIFTHSMELKFKKMLMIGGNLFLKGDFEVANKEKRTLYKRFFCPVKIKTASGEDIEINCLIDTGYSGFLSIDSSIEKKLGLQQIATSSNTSANAVFTARVYNGNISIGKSTFENIRVEAHEYPDKNDERGIIGMQLLSHGILHIGKNGDEFNYSFKI